MSIRKRPRRSSKVSKRTTVKKKVNKKGYTNKYGTRVGPYDRKVSSFPKSYTIYRIINGERRLCKITRRNGKEYIQILENRKKAQLITLAEAKKHFEKLPEHRQEVDKRFRAKRTFKQREILSSYLTKTGTSRYDVEGLDTPPTKEDSKGKKEEKKETAQKLVEREFERSDARKELEPIRTKFKLKENEWTIEEFGNSKYFFMHKDRILVYTTKEQFKGSTLGYMRQDNFEEVDLENSQVILTGGEHNFLGFGNKGSETLYLKSYINNAIKNLKNPKIYYREDYPLVIEGDENVMVLAPKVSDDDKYLSEQYDSILPYKEYKQISKKRTKKELINKIKEIDPESEYKKGETKDNLIKDYYRLTKEGKLYGKMSEKEIKKRIDEGASIPFDVREKMPEDLKKKYNNKIRLRELQENNIGGTEQALYLLKRDLELADPKYIEGGYQEIKETMGKETADKWRIEQKTNYNKERIEKAIEDREINLKQMYEDYEKMTTEEKTEALQEKYREKYKIIRMPNKKEKDKQKDTEKQKGLKRKAKGKPTELTTEEMQKEIKKDKRRERILKILNIQEEKDTIFINESELKQKISKEDYEFINKIASEREIPGIKYVTGSKLGTRALYIYPQEYGIEN